MIAGGGGPQTGTLAALPEHAEGIKLGWRFRYRSEPYWHRRWGCTGEVWPVAAIRLEALQTERLTRVSVLFARHVAVIVRRAAASRQALHHLAPDSEA